MIYILTNAFSVSIVGFTELSKIMNEQIVSAVVSTTMIIITVILNYSRGNINFEVINLNDVHISEYDVGKNLCTVLHTK